MEGALLSILGAGLLLETASILDYAPNSRAMPMKGLEGPENYFDELPSVRDKASQARQPRLRVGNLFITRPGSALFPRQVEVDELMDQLENSLHTLFPHNTYLPSELDGVIQALVDSIGWAVILAARETATPEWAAFVAMLQTEDRFATAWVSREMIIDSIQDTSGLDAAEADVALRAIEQFIDVGLTDGDALHISHIGVVRRGRSESYIIDLADELQVPVRAVA